MLKIYIVEDNLLMAAVLKHLLTSMGHEICGWANNYTKAVNELRKANVDVVITDIMLTGKKTGIDLGQHLKKTGVPFIYLSSVTTSDMVKAALNSSPCDYLFKPVSKPALAEALFNLPGKDGMYQNRKTPFFPAIAVNS